MVTHMEVGRHVTLRNLKWYRVTRVLSVGNRSRKVVWGPTVKGPCHKDVAPTDVSRDSHGRACGQYGDNMRTA